MKGWNILRLPLPAGVLVVALVSAALPAPAARTYYVSPDGDDRKGDGSRGRPWASISAAIVKVPDEGATILVRDGVYNGLVRASRRFANGVVVRAENPYRARLRHDSGAVIVISGAANIEMAGFDIARLPPPPKNSPLGIHIARSVHITLRDNLIHDSYNNDLLKINEESAGIVILGNVFHNQQGGAGQHIDINGCHDVFLLENIFFNDLAASGQPRTETHGFVVAKNSGRVPESRRIQIARNIFLHFEGSTGSNFILLGEDGLQFHEVQEVLIENNLMIGSSEVPMRAPLGIKGARKVVIRNNTVTGDLPARAFALRINREGRNPVNEQIAFFNNVWSDPTGTMGNFSDGRPDESQSLQLDNNAYWNGGKPLPGGQLIRPSDDTRAITADPRLPWPEKIVLPHWEGFRFRSGALTIRQEFLRLVREFALPQPGSALLGRADPRLAPPDDIHGALRDTRADSGAAQAGAAPPAVRLILAPGRIAAGQSSVLSRVMLAGPAPKGGVEVVLTSSNPRLAAVPSKVLVPEGVDSVAFPIRTETAEQEQRLTLSATYGAAVASAGLTIVPQGIVSIQLSEPVVWAGDSLHMVLLEGPAQPGLNIGLSSSRPDLITFQDLTGPPGRSYAIFRMRSKPVAELTPVTLTASMGASKASAAIRIKPGQSVTSLRLSRTHAWNGAPVTATVSISEPTGPVLRLSSEDPAAIVVPETVQVPPGQLHIDIPLQTRPIPGRKSVGVTVALDKTRITQWMVVGSSEIRSLGLHAPRGGRSAGILYITAPAPSDFRCELSSSRPEIASVPDSVLVQEGAVRAEFPIQVKGSPGAEGVEISATCRGRTMTARFP